jgi:hypothetical protein
MKMMEERYMQEYLFSSMCESIIEEQALYDMDLYFVYRRIIFKTFESYLRELEQKDG